MRERAATDLDPSCSWQSTFYYNGALVGESRQGQWRDTQSFHIDAACGTSPVLAIHGTDNAGVSAILASWTHCGATTKTDLGCRCTSEDPRSGQSEEDISWTASDFDDSCEETAPLCAIDSVRLT